MAGLYEDTLGYQCCFCNIGIESTNLDPCELLIITNFDKAEDKQEDQVFFCHIECFKRVLHTYKKILFKNIEYVRYICCFCNEKIESNNTNPCDLHILTNFDKAKNKQSNQMFFCHIECFKRVLHNEVKGMLILDDDDNENTD